MADAPASVTLHVADVVAGVTSNADGVALLVLLRRALYDNPGPVAVSLRGLPQFSSSFLNSSFGQLWEDAGETALRRLRFVAYKPAQLAQLQAYFAKMPKAA